MSGDGAPRCKRGATLLGEPVARLGLRAEPGLMLALAVLRPTDAVAIPGRVDAAPGLGGHSAGLLDRGGATLPTCRTIGKPPVELVLTEADRAAGKPDRRQVAAAR